MLIGTPGPAGCARLLPGLLHVLGLRLLAPLRLLAGAGPDPLSCGSVSSCSQGRRDRCPFGCMGHRLRPAEIFQPHRQCVTANDVGQELL